MIHKVFLKNFKKIQEETFLLSNFDLIVGINNSGKSTILQALAIWQYCVDQFRRAKRTGSRGIQIVLPNFTALPLPEFNLLWTERDVRKYKEIKGKNIPEYVYMEIDIYWKMENGLEQSFCVTMRYQSPQSVYAIPRNGWNQFKEIEGSLPRLVYVPPFSGIEPHEKWLDDGNVRQNVGKAQPGSVLRNLLYRVIDKELPVKENGDWIEIKTKVKEWFDVDLNQPQYVKGESTEIIVTYKYRGKEFDIISGGSGFHQILTLLAFLYGYPGITTILFDEPDAHLHVNLQQQILNYFKEKSGIQFITATHSEVFITGVEIGSVISILSGRPVRVQSSETIIKAMSEVNNLAVVRTKVSPYILYVEGEDDARILDSWATKLNKMGILSRFFIYHLGGTTKSEMKKRAENHFNALKQINTDIKKVMLFDYDSDDTSFHPEPDNPVLKEWKRKNIENYLLVPGAWKRAVLGVLNAREFNLLNNQYQTIIEDFFNEQGLSLPKGYNWNNVKANVFEVIDGKKLLFENKDSLFQRLRNAGDIKINREKVASAMDISMIHDDVITFFEHLTLLVG
jgi:predicted ATPase